MNRRIAIAALALMLAAPAVAAERLNDRDVKALIEKIDQTRDRFEDQIDGEMKRTTFKGSYGEINVAKFLDDFQDNIDLLKDRLKPEYEASREVKTVLDQATMVEGFLSRQPAGTKGMSEWNLLAVDFRTLASAYGTSFPLGPNAQFERITDRELTTAVESLKASADRLEKSLDDELKKIPAVTKPAREAMIDDVKQLGKDADTVRSRVGDNQPSATEATALLQRAARIDSALKMNAVPKSSAAWAGITTRLQTVAAAYQTMWPSK